MGLKHQSEWPVLIRIADLKYLDYEQKLLLLALRESEDGINGSEFNRSEAIGNDLDAQARSMCNFIKDKQSEYQRYILRLKPGNDPFDFIEYISISESNVLKVNEALKLVKEEFDPVQKENL